MADPTHKGASTARAISRANVKPIRKRHVSSTPPRWDPALARCGRIRAVDRQLRHPQDEPSIGLILCTGRNRAVAEYALHDLTRPLGVATYRLLPEEIRRQLSSPDELRQRLLQESRPGSE